MLSKNEKISLFLMLRIKHQRLQNIQLNTVDRELMEDICMLLKKGDITMDLALDAINERDEEARKKMLEYLSIGMRAYG